MAIAPTGNAFKALSFDNVSSRSYGVYITGEAVYNAPEREVEMISIPGRNGAFALDKGRFENIEVTYPAGVFADNEANFAEAISDFRNMLCSRKGYVQLKDEYNPGEYRLAIYKSGLEVEPAQLKAGQFNIVFDCKPQRYLTSGESPELVSDGGTLTNPTLFASHPLIMAEGYGDMVVNGYGISIANAMMGDVVVGEATHNGTGDPITQALDGNLYNAGDDLTLQPFSTKVRYRKKSGVSNIVLGTRTNCTASKSGDFITVTLQPDAYTFTANGDKSFNITGGVAITYDKGGASYGESLDVTVTVQYNATNKTLTYTNVRASTTGWAVIPAQNHAAEVIADSSVGILGNPTYLDCDLGVAYKIENDEVVSLNKYIDLGSKLPQLDPGSNEITFDNTFTGVSIIPRWCKV